MENEIKSILSGVKDKKIEQVGPFWQIRVGARAGARENGVSLARDLLKEHRKDVGEAAPVQAVTDYDTISESLKTLAATETVIERIVADPEQTARIADLEARLAEAEAALKEVHAPQVVPDAPIPDELADLISYSDTPVQSNEKLLVRLREVMGLIGLAEDDGHRAAPELYRRKDRLESGIRWNRGRSAEVI